MKTDKIQKLHLAVTPREQFGKNLKKMRHQGFVPANVFGPGFKSVSISTQVKDFSKAYKTAHETGVVYLDLNKDEIPTLIGQVQRHPVSNAIIHVDFRKIDLKQKIETTVPVKTVNDSPAIAQGGVLLTQSDHVLIEALPEEIPQEIEIDLSKLLEIGAEVRVKDLPASSGYVIKEDPEKILLSIIAHKEESVTPETTVATPEVLTEKEGDLTAEGTATEGAAPVEDKKAAELKEKTSEKKEKTS
ncbi:MAG: 50S ribosomal protein L25 [Microgenomates group bacterium]